MENADTRSPSRVTQDGAAEVRRDMSTMPSPTQTSTSAAGSPMRSSDGAAEVRRDMAVTTKKSDKKKKKKQKKGKNSEPPSDIPPERPSSGLLGGLRLPRMLWAPSSPEPSSPSPSPRPTETEIQSPALADNTAPSPVPSTISIQTPDNMIQNPIITSHTVPHAHAHAHAHSPHSSYSSSEQPIYAYAAPLEPVAIVNQGQYTPEQPRPEQAPSPYLSTTYNSNSNYNSRDEGFHCCKLHISFKTKRGQFLCYASIMLLIALVTGGVFLVLNLTNNSNTTARQDPLTIEQMCLDCQDSEGGCPCYCIDIIFAHYEDADLECSDDDHQRFLSIMDDGNDGDGDGDNTVEGNYTATRNIFLMARARAPKNGTTTSLPSTVPSDVPSDLPSYVPSDGPSLLRGKGDDAYYDDGTYDDMINRGHCSDNCYESVFDGSDWYPYECGRCCYEDYGDYAWRLDEYVESIECYE